MKAQTAKIRLRLSSTTQIAVLFVPIPIAFGETNTLNAKEQGNARGMMINIELGVEH